MMTTYTLSSIASGSTNGKNMRANDASSNEKLQDLENQYVHNKLSPNSIQKTQDPIQFVSKTDSIKQMELLRGQINSILCSSNADYLREDLNISNASSTDTVTLLRGHNLNELQFDERVLMSSLNSTALAKTSEQITQAYVDTSLVAENTILKESNRRERARRKYHEEQTSELQAKLLQCQDQLAVALSTERKKTIMIEQLDKNLAIVVNDWKKQEEERISAIFKLTREKEILLSSQQKQDQMLKRFEKDLADALQAYSNEQEKIQELNSHHKSQIDFLEKEKFTISKHFSDLQASNLNLKEINKKNEKVISEFENNQHVQKMENERLEKANNHLNEQIKLISKSYEEQIELVQKAVDDAQNESQDLLKKNLSLSHTVQQLMSEKESLNKEKDTLRTELKLLQTKFDVLKTKQDSEIKTKLEEEFNQKIYEIQHQIMTTESDLRNSEKKRLNELTAKHKDEVLQISLTYKKEIQLAKDTILKIQSQYEERLQDLEKMVVDLNIQNKFYKSKIKDLTSCLNAVKRHTTSIILAEEEQLMVDNGAQEYTDQLSSTLRSDSQLHLPLKASNNEYLNFRENDQYQNELRSQEVIKYFENKNNNENLSSMQCQNSPVSNLQRSSDLTNRRSPQYFNSKPFSLHAENCRPNTETFTSHIEKADCIQKQADIISYNELAKHNLGNHSFTFKEIVDQHSFHDAMLDTRPSRDILNQSQHFNEKNALNGSSQESSKLVIGLQNNSQPLKTKEESEREEQLYHFIQKLLQSSPSHISGRIEQEKNLLNLISDQVDHLMNETQRTKKINSLPIKNALTYREQKHEKRKDEGVENSKKVKDYLNAVDASNKQVIHLTKNVDIIEDNIDQNKLIKKSTQDSKMTHKKGRETRFSKEKQKTLKDKQKTKLKLKESDATQHTTAKDDTKYLKKDGKRSITPIWK
ncbi:trichohyalin isoform X4 [Hydra vulgaris]|uniref:Trichohyalin isoform X4 n=1 Tax=Hydra vulgaris TaxID=6087 RepID=A0ABM4B7M7_HYDVU